MAGPPGSAVIDPVAGALLRAATERLLWGTDWPHPLVTTEPKPDDAAMTCAIPALKAGASARCAAVFSAAYSWLVPPIGDWNVVATADAGNRVKEANEKNNGAGEQIRVKGDELPAH